MTTGCINEVIPMDELDEHIMEVLTKKGRKCRVDEIVESLSKDYNLNILRTKVRRHADSLTRYGFLEKTVLKRYSKRSSTYVYEVK